MLDHETIHEANHTAPISSHPPSGPSRRTLRSRLELRLETAPWALLVQVFIGLGWLRAAVEKLIDPAWWNGSVLSGFLDSHTELTLPWYQAVVDSVVSPDLVLVSLAVVVAQIFAALALLSGWNMRAGLVIGVFLNLNFIAAGAVNPSIFYVICQTALLLWILQSESGVSRRPLRLVATGSFVLVLLSAPFIRTIDPADVVEDPAAALVILGLLTATACLSGVRNYRNP